MSKFTITAGHSDTDPGAVANGLKEAALAVQLRDIVASKLRKLGHTVIEDGEDGKNQPLKTAISLIKGSDKAIEIHFNAATPTAKGVETIALPKDKILAQALSQTIARELGTSVRGEGGKGWIDQSQSHRGKLGFINAGGLIIEVAFITNQLEMDAYQDKFWLVASAIANVLDQWSKGFLRVS